MPPNSPDRLGLLSVAAHHRVRASLQALSDDVSKARDFEDKTASAILDLLDQYSSLTQRPKKIALLTAIINMIINIFSTDSTSCPTYIALAKRILIQIEGDVFWKLNLQAGIFY
jgi:hypothetical protein